MFSRAQTANDKDALPFNHCPSPPGFWVSCIVNWTFVFNRELCHCMNPEVLPKMATGVVFFSVINFESVKLPSSPLERGSCPCSVQNRSLFVHSDEEQAHRTSCFRGFSGTLHGFPYFWVFYNGGSGPLQGQQSSVFPLVPTSGVYPHSVPVTFICLFVYLTGPPLAGTPRSNASDGSTLVCLHRDPHWEHQSFCLALTCLLAMIGD